MLNKICNYLVGGVNELNIQRWKYQFGDDDLDVTYENMDPNMTFIIISTKNLFITTTFLNTVLDKLHEGIKRLQNTNFDTDVVISTMYRYDNVRIETELINSKSSEMRYNEYTHPLPPTYDDFMNSQSHIVELY
jgi:hypothetical protein